LVQLLSSVCVAALSAMTFALSPPQPDVPLFDALPGRCSSVTDVAPLVRISVRSPMYVWVTLNDRRRLLSVPAALTVWLSVAPVVLLSGIARFGVRQKFAATGTVVKPNAPDFAPSPQPLMPLTRQTFR